MTVEIEGRKVLVIKGDPNTDPHCLLTNAMGIERLVCYASEAQRDNDYNKMWKVLEPIVKCRKLIYK